MQNFSAHFQIDILCQVLQVSRSGYYRFVKGETYGLSAKKKEREKRILQLFSLHKRRYGTRRLRAALAKEGVRTGRGQIKSVLTQAALQAIQPRSFLPKTTDSAHGKRNAPNLLLEQKLPDRVNAVWISDITYLPLADGTFAYLCTWMDLFSRKIVAYQIETHMGEELVIKALAKGLAERKPPEGLILHSDRGSQYVSKKLRALMKNRHCEQSMSRADEVYDNAFAESFFSRLKSELMEKSTFLSVQEAGSEVFDYLVLYYNPLRLHSALGYKSPDEFEKEYHLNQFKSQVACPTF